jgi:hypothetical protein
MSTDQLKEPERAPELVEAVCLTTGEGVGFDWVGTAAALAVGAAAIDRLARLVIKMATVVFIITSPCGSTRFNTVAV